MLFVGNKTCVVVLGLHRGGTSIVSGILHSLGVDMGDLFHPPDERNRTGFFEDIGFLAIHDKIIGGDWERPNIHFRENESEYRELLAGIYKSKRLWGLKDPKLCLFFHQFLRVMADVMPNTEVLVVDVERNLNAIVASLCNKEKFPSGLEPGRAEKISRMYLFCKEQGLKFFSGRRHKLHHEDLLADPEGSVRRLAAFVGVAYKPEVLDMVMR